MVAKVPFTWPASTSLGQDGSCGPDGSTQRARLTRVRNRLFAPNSTAVAIGVGVVLVIGAAVATLWTGIGDPNLSAAGWIAMSFGVITHAGMV